MDTLLLDPSEAAVLIALGAFLIWLMRRIRILVGIALAIVVLVALTQVITSSTTRTRTRAACAGPAVAVFVVPASRFPNIAAHIRESQQSRPDWLRLCRNGLDEAGIAANRNQICGRIRTPREGLSCDEFPFASTWEGGEDSTVRFVPAEENTRQGVELSAFYRGSGVRAGDVFQVVPG